MVRSNWNGPLVVVLALVVSASAQTPAPLPLAPTKPGERLITVQELNRPPQACRILRSWQMADGTQAYQVQAVGTGEMMTITENGNLATPPSPGRRVRAVATRIYHWGRSLRSPAGVPMPPGEVIASSPQPVPEAVRLPREDTRVHTSTPFMTSTVPARSLPKEHVETVIVETPLPSPVVERRPLPMKGAAPAPAIAQQRKPVPAVTTSLQKQPADATVPPASPYSDRHWPTAYTGQQSPEPAVAALPVQTATGPDAVKSTAVPVKSNTVPVTTQVSPNKCNAPVASTVVGPCEVCEPKRPFFRRIFKRESKDECCQDPCATAPVTTITTRPVASMPSAPKLPDNQATTRPEVSKVIEPRPIAPAPTAPSDTSDWRKSWGQVAPPKPEVPIAKSVTLPPETIANTTPSTPKKDTGTDTPPIIPPTPKPLAQIASEPATTPARGKDEKKPEGWKPFWKRRETKKPEATARVEKKKSALPTPPVVPPPPTVDKNAKPAKKIDPPAPPAPTSTAEDWNSGGKKEDVSTRSTKVQGTSNRQAPAFLPETPLPRAHTEPDADPLARPSEFAKRSIVETRVKTDIAKPTETKVKTDVAKPTETKVKTDAVKLTETSKPDSKAKKTDIAQASVKESSPVKQTNTATPASATEHAGNPLGAGSVIASGAPQYIPVPIATVPNTTQPPTPPMPNIPQGPNPNYGKYVNPNPLTAPPLGYRNAFTNPGPGNPVPAETLPPELSKNAFSAPQFEGQGTPPPAIPALLRNTPTISPGPIVPVPPGTPVGGIPTKGAPMPGQCMPPIQGMPMQGMPQMQGVPQQQLPVPMQSNPMQQLPPMPVQPVGPANQGSQAVPGVAWMPQQQFVPAAYYHMPTASQVNFYTMPQQAMPVSYQQPQQPDAQSNMALLLQMLHESDYPSQREWAADQLSSQNGRVSPAVVTALVTAAKDDPAPMVRTQCIRSLTRMQVQTLPVVSLMQQMQQDRDPRVRDAANQAMTAMGMPVGKKTGDIQPASAPLMPKE